MLAQGYPNSIADANNVAKLDPRVLAGNSRE